MTPEDARKERIQAGQPEPDDLWSHSGAICPRCGETMPGAVAATVAKQKGKPVVSLHCNGCHKLFDCRVTVTYTFTTYQPEKDDQ